jgi:hypothetical protein
MYNLFNTLFVYINVVKQPLFISLFNGKETQLLVRVSTLEQDYQAQIYDLTQYGNSLGYTQFHIVERTQTASCNLHKGNV